MLLMKKACISLLTYWDNKVIISVNNNNQTTPVSNILNSKDFVTVLISNNKHFSVCYYG